MLPKAALLCLVLFAARMVPADDPTAPQAADDRIAHPACRHCGMDRSRFAHSRMLITYSGGTRVAVCSLHCGALDLALNVRRRPRTIQVGDYVTRDLVDAESAFWVLGGKMPGVMSARAKWAFFRKEAAEDFVRAHGGRLVDFSGALKASYDDTYEQVNALCRPREGRRQAMTP